MAQTYDFVRRDMNNNIPILPKELSWLSFNERVLQEAADSTVPEIQRIRYLGIYSNNLDEYFRVRVADVRRLATFTKGEKRQRYNALLDDIRKKLAVLDESFESTYMAVLKSLRKRRIYLVNEMQLDEKQASYVEKFFQESVFPLLSPFLLTDKMPLVTLSEPEIYFAVKMTLAEECRYGIVQIPSNTLPRFVEIPQPEGKKKKGGHVFIVLDNIIRHCLNDVFMGVFDLQNTEAFTFKITRDAELELGEGISQSLIDKLSQSLKERKKADPVRFSFDQTMPDDMLEVLKKRLKLGVHDTLMSGGRYHNSKDFMDFPNIGPKYLKYSELAATLPKIAKAKNIFESIREKDIGLYYPYHSFSVIINFLKLAAIDPEVRSIQMCLYRVASDSQVVDALINAVRNGKSVTAVVELQARFDEANNIRWAQRLTEAGVQVIFGIPGIKVHSKTILVTRMENSVPRYYSHIGTGNFNEKTARLYTDLSLLTYNQSIGRDMESLFQFLLRNYLRKEYEHIWVSPHSMRPNICKEIDAEIGFAKQGMKSDIIFKCNNLVDDQIIAKLYEASQAGVRIRLIVRGMCSLIPGLKNLSENIEVIGIVDRYLEHARIYIFGNAGAKKYYISSGDLMTRNIDFRVEVTCPIFDQDVQKLIDTIVETQLKDNVKARVLDAKMNNKVSKKGKRKVRSQELLHKQITGLTKVL